MERIKVKVNWCDKNYCASVEDVPGAVVVTAKTYDELKRQVREAVEFHLEGMAEDGDNLPQWLAAGEYEFEWCLEISALLRVCERYTNMAAISRASGVNEKQLSHYANGAKHPRPLQQVRIREGIKRIGRELTMINNA